MPTNREIAGVLVKIADLLEAKGENQFRVGSYRRAAQSVMATKTRLAQAVARDGAKGLTGIAGIGEKLAGLIEEFVQKGKVGLLSDLTSEVPPEKLKEVESKRKEHVFAKPLSLPVAMILEIDGEYRSRAAAGRLKKIAPKLLNPEKKAWLPIMSKEHKGYRFTVMYSNTATAHKLGKTNDWVVVYYEKGKGENQCTVVTESKGPLKGKRVIRGREKECGEVYAGGKK